MNTILEKLIDYRSTEITDEDIENELYELCDKFHSDCTDTDCPIIEKNNGEVPWDKTWEGNCICFKDGKKMLEFLREE